MRVRIILGIAGLLLTGAGLAFAGPVTSLPDPERGKQLAESLCTTCHLVDAGQEQANVDVPSFHEIAGKAGQTAGAIMAHIVLPKHPMPTIPLTKSELADLAAYIMSLRDQGERPNP
jgi:mono/diheme cytochrome c family protein